MHLVPAYVPDADYIDRQIDAELAAIQATAEQNPNPDERCVVCTNPRSEGTGNCVNDSNRPHLYPAEHAALQRRYNPTA
ncbi:MAG: hypothetical protein U5N21_14575 [Rhodococcus sp. (in: high G+C Gram-positive bacteria)]|nr:hypothetical protein [Rhodococcus sp. (in: high G+C Gram-positive bacteria)]